MNRKKKLLGLSGVRELGTGETWVSGVGIGDWGLGTGYWGWPLGKGGGESMKGKGGWGRKQ